jgi:hypothetical protein
MFWRSGRMAILSPPLLPVSLNQNIKKSLQIWKKGNFLAKCVIKYR